MGASLDGNLKERDFAVARSGLKERFPGAALREIKLRLFEISHGKELTDALRAELERRAGDPARNCQERRRA